MYAWCTKNIMNTKQKKNRNSNIMPATKPNYLHSPRPLGVCFLFFFLLFLKNCTRYFRMKEEAFRGYSFVFHCSALPPASGIFAWS